MIAKFTTTGSIPKKAPRLGVNDLVQKFEFIKLLSSHYKITDLCSCLKINRRSFYYWQKAQVIRLEKELPDKLLIEKAFNNHKKLAGYRTIRMDLENKYGVKMNTKKIRRLMNKYELRKQVRHKNPYKEIMKKTQEHATCANILNREYTNPEYRKLLKNNNVIQSMSRKGNCIDNAPMESFLGHFKDELDYKNCKIFEVLVVKIDEYMYYYNNEMYQWSKNKMTTVEYRSHLLLAS